MWRCDFDSWLLRTPQHMSILGRVRQDQHEPENLELQNWGEGTEDGLYVYNKKVYIP